MKCHYWVIWNQEHQTRNNWLKPFSKMEENLQEFIGEIKEKDDMDLLLSFEPLVEGPAERKPIG